MHRIVIDRSRSSYEAWLHREGPAAAALLGIALAITIVMAWPVLRAPSRVIFGHEIVGRHPDPFTVMQQFDAGTAPAPYRQPLTDAAGAALANVVGPVAAYNAVESTELPRTGLTLVHASPDATVYGVTATAPAVVVVARTGFFDIERGEHEAWRWMGPAASWTLRNMNGEQTTTAIDLELSAFRGNRRLDVRYEGAPLTTLIVEPTRQHYRIGPFAVPPGDHQLTFVAAAPSADAAATDRIDDRPLTVMFGPWRWSAS
jgi:hypothetical protein